MNEKQRTNDNSNPGGLPDGPAGGSANLEQVRQDASAFLAAADDAINQVLSGDSTKFNQSARQEGGE